MNNTVKSIIRHILTAIGAILTFIGLDEFTEIVTFLQNSLDGLWDAILLVVGVITTIIGFFKGRDSETPKNE